MSGPEPVMGIPRLLQYLATMPDGWQVTHALVEGVLSHYECAAAMVWLLETPKELHLFGYYGMSDDHLARWHKVPVSVPTQMAKSVRDGEILASTIVDFTKDYPDVEFDEHKWRQLIGTVSNGDILSVPLSAKGLTVGVLQFATYTPRTWSIRDFNVLEGIGSALSLWATHQDRPLRLLPAAMEAQQPLALTDRQLQILRAISRGRSNAAIAAALGFSQSTVKQEVQRMLRAMLVVEREQLPATALRLGLCAPEFLQTSVEQLPQMHPGLIDAGVNT